MISATDLKAGVTFLHYDKPYQVVKYTLIKMGRGSATVRVAVKNLENGANEEKTFQSNASVDEIATFKRKLQFLYKDDGKIVFMDPVNFEQVEVPVKVLGDQFLYLKEGEGINILFWGDKALSIELPVNIVLTVAQADPGVRGNSATNLYKPAVLENGLKVKVPLFIKTGDKIKVDTRTGEYIERFK